MSLVVGCQKRHTMYSNKANLKKCPLWLYLTEIEKRYVEACAKKAGLILSHYVRQQALQGFVPKEKILPAEVLAFRGTLLHLAGQLQPLARKRLDGDELNALERAELRRTRESIDEVLSQIKK